jgi:hypothetical protein
MDDAAANLIAMGFDPDTVQKALRVCGGNAERAIELLLSGAPVEEPPAAPSESALTQADISQYSVENGRSACTCIALTGAALYLQEGDTSTTLTADLLRNMVTKGVNTYQGIARSSPGVEHMSAEEVLQQNNPDFPLQILGGVRQGITSHDINHPMGMKALLQGCEGARVVVITKTPETVVVCLDQFALVDSHPRPPLAMNAYAKIHTNLNDLVQSLASIFPPTDLGPDIPEMMAMMYNSFDLYPLALKR